MSKPFEPSVRVRILSDSDIRRIHTSALEVLERTGVAIRTEEGRRILLDAGCGESGEYGVLIPARLVERALKTAPSSITLYDRRGETGCVLEGWKTSFGTGSDCPFILDRDTLEKRR